MQRTLTLAVETSALPTEFRIFTAGIVDTVKGRFLFDARAAKLVIAEYEAHGIDLMIDYDHASLSTESAVDPALAGKAAGWFNLELRSGALWAVNVRWSPPAAAALLRKEWRFMSPAFSTDKHGRVTALLNVALTNIPATRRLDALIAASSKGKSIVDPSLIMKALEAIESGDAKAAMEILKNLIASASGEDPDADGDEDGSEDDGAEGVAPIAEAGGADPKVAGAAGATDPADEDDEDDGKKPAPPAAKKAASRALNAMICRLTGKTTLAEAVVEVEAFRASHLTLETERVKLAKERATLESVERRGLVVSLIKLGAEYPATVWSDDKSTTLKSRWSAMPIAELRSHVADQRTARGDKSARRMTPAGAGVSAEGVELSADELRICATMKCDPKDFAALKAFRDGKKGN